MLIPTNLQYFPLTLIKHFFIVTSLFEYRLDTAIMKAICAQNEMKRPARDVMKETVPLIVSGINDNGLTGNNINALPKIVIPIKRQIFSLYKNKDCFNISPILMDLLDLMLSSYSIAAPPSLTLSRVKIREPRVMVLGTFSPRSIARAV